MCVIRGEGVWGVGGSREAVDMLVEEYTLLLIDLAFTQQPLGHLTKKPICKRLLNDGHSVASSCENTLIEDATPQVG